MKFPTRLLTSLLLITTLFWSTARPALAFGGPFFYLKDIYIPAVYDDQNINLQKHVKETIMIVPWAMIDIAFSWIFPSGVKFVRDCVDTTNVTSGVVNVLQNGANCLADFASIPLLTDASGNLTPMGKIAVASYSMPTPRLPSTVTFLTQSFDQFIHIPQAKAQGAGYNALNQSDTLTGLWKAFRNLAYALSAFILIIMGLMIMFRVKLSPQAVLTVEQAIPKFAVTLLLITFSFAIAGLAIDLTWVLNSFFVLLINTAAIPSPDILANMMATLCRLTGQGNCAFTNFTNGSTFNYDVGVLNNPLGGNVIFLSLVAIFVLLWKSIAILSAFSTIGGIIGLIVGLVFIIIALIALVFNMFRVIFTLAKVYAQVIITIVFGPLVILIGALPQSPGGFTSWLGSLLENVLALPIVSGMFLLGITLLMSVPVQIGIQSNTGWSTPQIGGSPDLAIILAGYSILMAIPKVPDMLKSFFAKKPFDFATAIGEATKPAGTIAKGGASAAITPLDRGGDTSKAVAAGLRTILGIK